VARSAEQTLITAAVVDDVPEELRGARVEVGSGYAIVVKDGGVADGAVTDGAVADGRVP
jgi:DNA replication and repair protein RecF